MGASTTLFNCRRRRDAYYAPGPMATNNSWDFVFRISNLLLDFGMHCLCDSLPAHTVVILSPRGGATPLLYVNLHT